MKGTQNPSTVADPVLRQPVLLRITVDQFLRLGARQMVLLEGRHAGWRAGPIHALWPRWYSPRGGRRHQSSGSDSRRVCPQSRRGPLSAGKSTGGGRLVACAPWKTVPVRRRAGTKRAESRLALKGRTKPLDPSKPKKALIMQSRLLCRGRGREGRNQSLDH
jgi:hypothetical protein